MVDLEHGDAGLLTLPDAVFASVLSLLSKDQQLKLAQTCRKLRDQCFRVVEALTYHNLQTHKPNPSCVLAQAASRDLPLKLTVAVPAGEPGALALERQLAHGVNNPRWSAVQQLTLEGSEAEVGMPAAAFACMPGACATCGHSRACTAPCIVLTPCTPRHLSRDVLVHH